MQRLADLVIGESAERVAFVRTLEIVVRTEVERRRAGQERAVRTDLERADVGEEGAVRGGLRTAAAEVVAGRSSRRRRAVAERAAGIVAVALQHRMLAAIGGVGGDVAMSIVEAGAHHEAGVDGAAVRRVADGRNVATCRIRQLIVADVVVIHVIEEAVLGVHADAFELRVHHEVDDARDGVRAVDRRSAAGQHVDAVDGESGDEVDVGDRRARIARHQAAAVDQHEGAPRAEAAQVDRRGAGGAVRDVRALGSEGLRQGVDDVFGAGRALQLDLSVVEDGDRAGRSEVRLRNAGAGDDDALPGVAFAVGRRGARRTLDGPGLRLGLVAGARRGRARRVALREGRRRNSHRAADKGGGEKRIQNPGLVHVRPLYAAFDRRAYSSLSTSDKAGEPLTIYRL